jgi:hypothetical protein
MSAGVDPFPAKPAILLNLVSSSSDSDRSPEVAFKKVLNIVLKVTQFLHYTNKYFFIT